jgi:thiol-disulfide isomerase/thioredoxin
VKKILYYIIAPLLFACSGNVQEKQPDYSNLDFLVEGNWHLSLDLSVENKLPVDFVLEKKDSAYQVEFINADERILATDIVITGKKIIIKDPVFNSWFEGEIISPTKIKGFWFKEGKDYQIAFEASHGINRRFEKPEYTDNWQPNISGKWEVDFSKNNPEGSYKAIGQFQQEEDYVSGTFITETGDYRFLEGNMYNDELSLSCFDGAHAFLFKATLGKDDTLRGMFWSGNHWEEPWVAYKNEEFKLGNPDSLTYLKEGYNELAFTFPNTEGKKVSLADEKYQNKVVIVNIMGPWCPNCKDETAYLTKLYNDKVESGLEIIALSYDKSEDVGKATESINKIRNHFNAKYEFLIAGKADKLESAKTLPMLNHIMSYPTSIFIDRKGVIRKIRTGFYGPGTGMYHTRYIEQTNDFVDKLLDEK